MILGMLLSNSIVFDGYYWERIAFRAAWISVTQVPLVYLLASKNNIIGLFIGLSHERLNWLHRWVSRTLLITATIHGSFFLREWTIADFVALELEIMPMVKYGIGAWAILTWTFVSSLTPLRRLAYEFFVLQHLAAAVLLLWILYVHVPYYAQYHVWFAIAVLSLDFVIKGALTVYCNLSWGNSSTIFGHSVELVSSTSDWTEIKIKNVHFKWAPGQYVYLWLPFLGPVESHPFTIANACSQDAEDSRSIHLVARAHKGFSRRLQVFAARPSSSAGRLTLGFVRGPYGVPPAWDTYESVVLISSSTGASFTFPVLQHLVGRTHRGSVRRIVVLLIAQHKGQISWYTERMVDFTAAAQRLGIDLRIQIAITQQSSTGLEAQLKRASDTGSSSASSIEKESVRSRRELVKDAEALVGSDDDYVDISSDVTSEGLTTTYGRPDISDVIRRPVERSGGETVVAVCGGRELLTAAQNCVARLSDERAVHKGTGAQGIRLHVEQFDM